MHPLDLGCHPGDDLVVIGLDEKDHGDERVEVVHDEGVDCVKGNLAFAGEQPDKVELVIRAGHEGVVANRLPVRYGRADALDKLAAGVGVGDGLVIKGGGNVKDPLVVK